MSDQPLSKQIICEHVLFVMPRDWELLFPAMTCLQKYVNTYVQRMTTPDPSHGNALYEIRYAVDIEPAAWDLFQTLEIELKQQPATIKNPPDVLIDMSDARLLAMKDTGKHATQVCGIYSGCPSTTFATMRRVTPKVGSFRWATLEVSCAELGLPDGLETLTVEQVLALKNGELTGLVGMASWQSFMALSIGLPLIEIVPPTRPRNWLSKWANGGYRVVSGKGPEEWGPQIVAAMRSVDRELETQVRTKYNERVRFQQSPIST